LVIVSTRACLIVNPAAGGGRAGRAAPAAERALRDRGLTVRRADTRDLGHARELGRAAARSGETVVALGGDGLVGVLADALRDLPGAVLGLIPGGRGNDLARVLGIPDQYQAAAAIIADGHGRPVDLGLVVGQPPARWERAFVGIASAGFDSDANRIANEAPSWLGSLVYAYAALRALVSWRPARFEVELHPSGERLRFTGYSIGAANSRAYGGGMRAAPDAMLDDGLLDVVVLESVGKVRFLIGILPKVFRGTHVHEAGVKVFRAHEISLSSDRPFTMYADGDPIAPLPVGVRALRGAITMLIPRARGEDSAFSERPPRPAGARHAATPGPTPATPRQPSATD
jgi:YegS/Rv2252/BmrU family lipid kinase